MRRQAMTNRTPYPSTIGDEEWAVVGPYLALCREDAWQRQYPSWDVYTRCHGVTGRAGGTADPTGTASATRCSASQSQDAWG